MQASALFDPTFPRELKRFFGPKLSVWEWIAQILPSLKGLQYIHPTAQVHASAVIDGPVYLGPDVRVGPFAFLRGGVIALRGATLGYSGEFKNALLMPGACAAHHNYVGDSILGTHAHLGCGVVCANLRFDEAPVRVGAEVTPFKKLGAFVGDGAQVGCNAVLLPGTIVQRGAWVQPLTKAGGLIEARGTASHV